MQNVETPAVKRDSSRSVTEQRGVSEHRVTKSMLAITGFSPVCDAIHLEGRQGGGTQCCRQHASEHRMNKGRRNAKRHRSIKGGRNAIGHMIMAFSQLL